MPDVTISYKGSQIASMDASGTKTLLTEGKYCEDDISIQYTRYSPEVYAGAHHSVIAIISFTIGSTSYQAQDGMTWGEWVESEYNTGGFYANDNDVFANASHYITGSTLTNVIIEGRAYAISTYGGGN